MQEEKNGKLNWFRGQDKTIGDYLRKSNHPLQLQVIQTADIKWI